MRRGESARVLCGVVLVAIMTWGGGLYGRLTADSRLDPDVRPDKFPVTVQVELSFRPTQYHRDVLYAYGAYDGRHSTERSVRLRRVTHESLEALSRYYWIDSIVPNPDQAPAP